MKKIIKSWFLNCVGIAVLGWQFPGLNVSFYLQDFFLASLILTLVAKVVKPVFEIVFLPLNLMTLGVFRWLRMIISFGITIYLSPGLNLQEFIFPEINFNGVQIQAFSVTSILSLVISSIILFYLKKTIRWLFRSK